jgi:hypothetical protein
MTVPEFHGHFCFKPGPVVLICGRPYRIFLRRAPNCVNPCDGFTKLYELHLKKENPGVG